MSSTGYLIWFIATTVMTVVVIGGGVALGTGAFDRSERDRRKVHHEAERAARARVEVPAQRSGSVSRRASAPATEHTAASRRP